MSPCVSESGSVQQCAHVCMDVGFRVHVVVGHMPRRGGDWALVRAVGMWTKQVPVHMWTQQVPVHMAVLHEEIASMLLLLDAKQGKDLEKLVKTHKGSIQGALARAHIVSTLPRC